MKKSFKILCLMLVVFMMTGCMKFQTNMTINKDKSMNYSLTYAIANSLVEQASGEASFGNESLKELEKQGFKSEDYSDGSMTGVKLSKNFDNIDEISNEKEVNFNLEAIMNGSEQTDMFTVKKGFFKNTYTLKIENNTSNEVQNGMNSVADSNEVNGLENQTTDTNTDTTQDTVPNESSNITNDDSTTDNQSDFSSDIDLSMLSSSMDMTFNINLPYKAISSNATSTENDGKNLKWNLLDTNLQNITAEFELYNMNNIYLTVGIGVALIIIIIIIITIKKRKPKAPVGTPVSVENQPINNINQNPQPVTPVPNMTANQTMVDTSDLVQNTNIVQEPLNQNTQTTDSTIETLGIDSTPKEPLSTIDTAPTPQVIPTPSTSPVEPVIPTVQESEVETLELDSEPTSVQQPIDTQSENNNMRQN